MARFQVRIIFLTLTFLLGGFIQTFANSTQAASNFSGETSAHNSSVSDIEASDESIDLPTSSHGNGKDFCLHLVERAEEQELECKFFKKKIDRTPNAGFVSDALLNCSLFVTNNKLSSPRWRDPSATTYPKYLVYRNLRS